MKTYILDNNIDFVKGMKNMTIVNLNAGEVHCCDVQAYSVLDELKEKGCSETRIEEDEFLAYLKKERILVKTEERSPVKYYKEPRINYAWIEITKNCQLKCVHCYNESSGCSGKSQMDFETFKIAVERLIEYGIEHVQLIGGEPLVNKEIMHFLDYMSGKFRSIEVFTNGLLITDAFLDKCVEYGVKLAFSIYSDSSEVHEKITLVSGSHQKTVDAIERAKARGIACRTSTIVMEMNERRYECKMCDNHRRDYPRVTGNADLSLYTETLLKKKLIHPDNFSLPVDFSTYMMRKEYNTCFGTKVYIDTDLDVYPCVMERRLAHGNIKNKSLEEIVQEDIKRLNKDRVDTCKDCEYRYLCHDCRPDSLHGDNTHAKPWHCPYDPYSGEWEDKDSFVAKLMGGV